jgi:hypothetical protein
MRPVNAVEGYLWDQNGLSVVGASVKPATSVPVGAGEQHEERNAETDSAATKHTANKNLNNGFFFTSYLLNKIHLFILLFTTKS